MIKTESETIDRCDFTADGAGPAAPLWFGRIDALGAGAVAMGAFAGLLGYVSGLEILGSMRIGYIPMAPSTALCFLVLSAVLFIHGKRRLQNPNSGMIAMAVPVFLVTAFALTESFYPLSQIDFEDWLMPVVGMLGQIPIGRMSPATGGGFVVAGLGTLFWLTRARWPRQTQRFGHAASSLGVLTALIGATVLLAYLYGTPLMYGGSTVPMAATTAINFVFFGVALAAAAGPASHPARLLIGGATSARLSRIFLPLTLAALLIQSGLSRVLSGTFAGHEAVLLAVLTVVMGTVTMLVAARVTQAIGGRLDAFGAMLQESEQNIAVTLNSIGDAVIATDQDGCVTRMNPTAERLSGWTLADARHRPLVEVFRIVNAQTRETVADPVRLVMAHGGVVGLANHTVLLARDGREYQIADSAAPIRNALGEILGVVLVFSDVTEKYRIDEELRESEARFRTLIEWSPQAICVYEGGKYVYFNPAAVKMLGAQSDQDLIGKTIPDLVHPDFRQVVKGRMESIARSGVAPLLELKVLRLDGTVVDVEAQGIAITFGGRPAARLSWRDIGDRRRAQEAQTRLALVDAERRHLAAIVESCGNAIMSVTLEGIYTSWNHGAETLFGFLRNEMIGRSMFDLMSADEVAVERARLASVADGESITGDEACRKHKMGHLVYVSLSLSPILDQTGAIIGVSRVALDITARKQAEERIEELAFHDQLTGLANRTLFRDRLRHSMSTSRRSENFGALLFIDLDNFKTLNDTHGHEKGDLLLRQVARRLTDCVREGDTVARLGGDEFVVALTELGRNQEEAARCAETVIEKILASLNQPYQLDHIAHHGTASVGITLFTGHHASADDLMKQADLAMYKAKSAGRNTYRFFDLRMESAVQERALLEKDMHRALKEQQFLLYYQAQVLSNGSVTGAEALVRWQHPLRGMVYPAEFIAFSEETGLILPLGHWVLEAVCKQLAKWAKRPEMADLTLAVNVSAHQFREADFVEQVLAVLAATGANPQRLELELTESLLVSNVEDIIFKMNALKEKGVRFSLDDFGTGYSSLSYLRRLPLNKLKIDQSFVRDVLIDQNDAAIAQTIVALSQSLGMGVIAEGVETLQQRDFLENAGCHAYQGYFFSRPLPMADFEDYVERLRAP